MNLKYRIQYNLEQLILDKRVGLGIAILSPIIFLISGFYLSGYSRVVGVDNNFNDIANYIKSASAGDETTESDISVVNDKSAFAEALEPIFTEPKRLFTEDKKLDVELIMVGVDESGMLLSPVNWNEGGWYEQGAKPGQTGNMIINAHYDTNFGQPAAFWELKNVKVDDKLTVLDRYEKSYTYIVKDSFYVDINDPTRLQIFENEENSSTMTLITCGGIWLPGQSTYNKRLVVKAELLTK
ncbi:hypothetical protein A2415_02285 [candidate division WWE3 bacterium RIFOXYC1_FULL_39_7]|uniref:Sortase n=2 Tax=Katanobacteria TaxID=422282 RepID=A0A1F4X5V0_UNCKA|nr:MAG: hypothetical protein A2415_02285 [candidate division WWE3 bacterium RIFOXYC1_FULL_39_7]OGC77047.1 MAG: hypothetical protein A2619_01450 [candidate division WWE3 bacterium RIFOXYD1_FULL_39_9]